MPRPVRFRSLPSGAATRPRRRGPPPAAPREPRRRPGPLPPGPYSVPISTIDWLVSRESLAARYVALRDLLGRPSKDLELRRARQAVPRDPWTRDVLDVLRRRTRPGTPLTELCRRYDGGAWLTLFLAETGCDRTIPPMGHAGDLLFAAWEKAFVQLSRRRDVPADVVAFISACRALALMGHAGDARLVAAADAVARLALHGGAPAAKSLLLFATVPEEKRSPDLFRAAEFLAARALEGGSPGAEGPAMPREFLRAGFPSGGETDLCELLYAIALVTPSGASAGREGPLAPALSLLLSRADHRGRWALERPPLPGLPYPLERTGELSRWVTMRALVAVQRFLGLRIEGARPAPRRSAR